jgi:carbonic anhydrase/acetyltransferase-like protein (isoleucine patch superfamily)
VVQFQKNVPSVKGSFIAPTASVIGKVKIGMNSSVWYGAVVRGAFY